jgi:outer membrane immunogenic protein
MNWLATVTGRLGYAWDRVLLYAKGGVAFADEEHDFGFFVDLLPVASTGEKTRTGWTVGGGVEVAFAGNWSFKAEYNFMDFGDKDVGFTNQFGDFVGSARIDQQIHVAKVGLNYRFGGFGGPVVARY